MSYTEVPAAASDVAVLATTVTTAAIGSADTTATVIATATGSTYTTTFNQLQICKTSQHNLENPCAGSNPHSIPHGACVLVDSGSNLLDDVSAKVFVSWYRSIHSRRPPASS